jgi:ABC-type nitrate/sulfonate/bicarbonate transport system permease component
MNNEQYIKTEMRKVSRQSFWLGAILGLLGGLALGFAIGYSQVGQTVVIPLTEGLKV